jgi:hypothetical protein
MRAMPGESPEDTKLNADCKVAKRLFASGDSQEIRSESAYCRYYFRKVVHTHTHTLRALLQTVQTLKMYDMQQYDLQQYTGIYFLFFLDLFVNLFFLGESWEVFGITWEFNFFGTLLGEMFWDLLGPVWDFTSLGKSFG